MRILIVLAAFCNHVILGNIYIIQAVWFSYLMKHL